MRANVLCENPSCHRVIFIGDPKLKPHGLRYCKRCAELQSVMAVHAKGDLN